MPNVNRQHPAYVTDSQPLLRPLFLCGLVALAATAAALALPPVAAICLAAGAGLCLLFPALRRGGRWLLWLTAILFLFNTAGYTHRRVNPITAQAGQTDTLSARVVAVPSGGTMYTVEITESTRLPAGTRVSLYCAEGNSLALCDTVTATVTLEEVTYSRTNLYAAGVYLCAFPTDKWGATITLTGVDTPPAASRLQGWFERQLRQVLPGDEGDLLTALCLGKRSAVRDSVTTAFRYSGLSHLLVVSGLHLSMVAVALRGLLRRLGGGYRTAALLTIPLIWLFAALTGGANSVLRAGLMCSLWLLGFVCYRRYDGLTAWGMAMLLLLLSNPYRLLHAGFQLSFAATAGVLLMAPRLCRVTRWEDPSVSWTRRVRRGVIAYIRNGCGVCIAALLFTLPLSVYYFGGISLTALPANLLAVIPAGWALTIGWLGMLLGGIPLLGWVSRPLLLVAGGLARYLQTVAVLCGPNEAYLSTPYGWQTVWVAVLCLLIAIGIWWRIPLRRILVSVVALGVAFCGVCLPLTYTTTQVTITAHGPHASVVIQRGGRTALLVSHSAALEDALWTLEERGCTRLTHLFVAAGAPCDNGTLATLTRQVAVDSLHTTDAAWHRYAQNTVHLCTADDTHPLWCGLSLTAVTDGLWQLHTPGADALLVTDPTTHPDTTAALTVYAGIPTTPPATGACVVTCPATTKQNPPLSLPANTYLLAEQSITLTTRNGKEWSVLSWL